MWEEKRKGRKKEVDAHFVDFAFVRVGWKRASILQLAFQPTNLCGHFINFRVENKAWKSCRYIPEVRQGHNFQ